MMGVCWCYLLFKLLWLLLFPKQISSMCFWIVDDSKQ